MLRIDEHECRRFGIRIARAAALPANAGVGALNAVLGACVEQNVKMLVVRTPAEDLTLVHALERAGFLLMDCLAYYRAAVNDAAVQPRTDDIEISLVHPAEIAEYVHEVEEVASLCYADYSGHYHADERLDRRASVSAYVDWARRSVLEPGVARRILVARHNGKIRGFFTLRLNSGSEGEAVISGVHPMIGGRGVYGNFVDEAKAWCKSEGRPTLLFTTQITNVKVQRSFVTRGFLLERFYYTFHRWFD